jgi:hypothetical protein
VLEPAADLGLQHEPRAEVEALGLFMLDHLERDLATELLVLGLVDQPHPPLGVGFFIV